jgi:radical SAM superfamily enzyme with C-terminal helix-hairpin-helix motif
MSRGIQCSSLLVLVHLLLDNYVARYTYGDQAESWPLLVGEFDTTRELVRHDRSVVDHNGV